MGDLMNNTSCSVLDASADNNKAGFYCGSTRRVRERGTLAWTPGDKSGIHREHCLA